MQALQNTGAKERESWGFYFHLLERVGAGRSRDRMMRASVISVLAVFPRTNIPVDLTKAREFRLICNIPNIFLLCTEISDLRERLKFKWRNYWAISTCWFGGHESLVDDLPIISREEEVLGEERKKRRKEKRSLAVASDRCHIAVATTNLQQFRRELGNLFRWIIRLFGDEKESLDIFEKKSTWCIADRCWRHDT